ncbi:MAG: hypothetical protein KKH41_00570 [Candidatus Thermoplasmatota archaeon]|nr:hypothetical protein [Euryarchaeota archaeon]MBU4031584.1 hypothetical protein [Candidatus Thermoplasmatota archaeon]MBU4071161.1 hypothetical protein [Candidatus Thermoplasmatota archaeon]MBU4145075.1 hypothetical protein [Candidatus Thermoplasmatota archaeon]MBU4591056.1 hypothetical protein [Candidatus Thermoplasmatota archaeon]
MKTKSQENRMIDATDLLMDMDMERILLGTCDKPRCAPELSELYGIPVLACFKKIKELKKRGLLSVTETVRTSNGRKIEYYSANLENAYVFYDSGRVKVRFTVVVQMAQDFRKRYERSTGGPDSGPGMDAEDNQE